MTKKTRPVAGTIYATQELISRERFVGQIYLPGQKGSGMESILFCNGNYLFMTSADFLEYEHHCPNIVCEPSPKVAIPWVHRALDLAFNKIAFLLPTRFMESVEAKNLFDKTPLVRVYILTKHLPFRRGASAWFVWEKGNLEAPKIRWI